MTKDDIYIGQSGKIANFPTQIVGYLEWDGKVRRLMVKFPSGDEETVVPEKVTLGG